MAPLVAFSFTSTINLCIHRGIPSQELIVHVMCKIFQVHGTDNTKQKVKICDAMSRDDVERQYLPAMKCIWEAVDKLWKPADVLTPLGHHFCQMWAVRAAHPEFPYALHMLTCMCALVNGARVAIFPTSASPLVAFSLNVNYSQTRKSSMTAHADQVTQELDKVVAERVANAIREEWGQLPDEQRGSGRLVGLLSAVCHFFKHIDSATPILYFTLITSGSVFQTCLRGTDGFFLKLVSDARPPTAKLRSCGIASATPEEWFHRCAADFGQVTNAARLPEGRDWHGRQWLGILGNLDEAYDFLLSFGLLDDGSRPATKSGSKINPHQSALNKLLQFGSAARATKTGGTYGETSLSVSLGVTSNLHPRTYVPMERGECGSHHAATKERFLVSSGRPVQPHEDLPSDFVMPEGAPSVFAL